jgi:molybdopterin synthase catalytic subunit
MEFYDIRVNRDPINAAELNFSPTEGAVVDFFGVVRALEGSRLIEGIEYEAFQPMAERQLLTIAEEAKSRHGLRLVVIHHRIGFVPAGKASLFVRVTARHRGAAFEGSSQIIEQLKIAVPIWKHPVYAQAQMA